jgi:hypothetical protein
MSRKGTQQQFGASTDLCRPWSKRRWQNSSALTGKGADSHAPKRYADGRTKSRVGICMNTVKSFLQGNYQVGGMGESAI